SALLDGLQISGADPKALGYLVDRQALAFAGAAQQVAHGIPPRLERRNVAEIAGMARVLGGVQKLPLASRHLPVRVDREKRIMRRRGTGSRSGRPSSRRGQGPDRPWSPSNR